MTRPDTLFDRETEWSTLNAFAEAPLTGPMIALVHGRRRHGKSYLLEELTTTLGGFYHQAIEEERAPALARLASAIRAGAGEPDLPGARFDDWADAFRAVADRAAGRPIVLDEFPYLVGTSPELPSILQAAFDAAKRDRHPPFRLILCGSALSVMARLLTGQSALRGRATVDLAIGAFDAPDARRFWAIDDVETAFLVHAVVGGAPGYRDLLAAVGTPERPADVAAWLAAGVLNPAHALFREAEYLLAEDPSLADRALYQSMIAAVAGGATTRNRLAERLGRATTALEHSLSQLERAGFLVRDDDLLRGRRPLLRVVDPLVRFQFAIIRPDQARFEVGRTAEAWAAADSRFRAQVLGPHFEAMARHWTANRASTETLGGLARRVGFAQVNDPERAQRFELDVVVEADAPRRDDRPTFLAIGEAKSGDEPRGIGDLARLERLRGSLAARAEVAETRLLLFSRSSFDEELRVAASARSDVELVDLERLYEGD